jgi:uncharacterized membrane protein
MRVLLLLPVADWLAVIGFFAAWGGYAWFARNQIASRHSLLTATNHFRRLWLQQASVRDPRVLDGIITQSLSTTPAFFSSTTIIIIGGLFAVLGTSDRAAELVRDIPFVARTSILIFDLKLMLLIGIFVYAFFRFSWSMRQYTFVALLIGAMPDARQFASAEGELKLEAQNERETIIHRVSRMVGLAAETFNDGLRAYYLSFAAGAWFLSPIAFAIGTAIVIWILYRREFQSEVVKVLSD